MIRCVKIFVLLFLFFVKAEAQIIINEASTNNISGLADNDGDYSDWIELFNAGASPVNLLNYKLSDDAANYAKWTFPSVSIPAGGYLTVFASDKNRVDFVDHWESLVLENNSWKYTIPATNIPGWTNTAFSDAAWTTGNGGLGYGDGDDATTVAAGTVSIYARRTFNLVDASAIQNLILHMDYDDGFVAYLNGVEIARANIVSSPVDYNSLADTDREAVMYTGGNPTAFPINKSVFQPLLVTGTNVLSIEIHNKSNTSSDLTMRAFLLAGISDASINYQALPGWFTPPAISNNIHTNFKLSASGETIFLSNPSNTVINALVVPAIQPNDVFGRFPNGSAVNRLLVPATPSASNGTATAMNGYWSDVVTMNPPAGYYSAAQSVTISAGSGLSTIRFTVDGTKPTATSPIYTGPISVTATQVVRAAVFRTGFITSNTSYETNSYFINDNTSIPVLSISTAPANFFSSASGIYVDGPNVGTCAAPHYCYNYWQDWEREIHVEYFDKTKAFQFEQDAGVKILGGWSRANPMKSLQLRAGDEYGKSKFDYPLFTETKKSGLREFNTFTLRNGGNDFNYTMLRDAVNHRVLNSLQPCVDNNLDFQGYEPVLLYINGQYWGLHTLRERVDNSYFDNNAGIDKGDYNLGETSADGRLVTKKGTITDFQSLLSFVNTNSMTSSTNYTTVKNWLDIANFADYFIAETFHTNWDWPHNNVKFWKPKIGGKWRYIYHDTDFAYGIFGGVYATPTTNEFNRITVTELSRSEHAPLFQKLLTNTEFKNYYINRSADLLNTIYNTPYLRTFYDGLAAQIAPEMTRHFLRWPVNVANVAGWNSERTYVKNFMDSRVANVRNQLTSTFGAGAQVTVTLNTSPAGAGKIKISTITPCSLPWNGIYFNGVPVTMEVIPNDGYVFSHWLSNTLITAPNTNKSITLNITSTDQFTAYFTTTTNIPKLTITELNYHSDTTGVGSIDAGDWIELYNEGNSPLDLSGWVLKDSKVYHQFPFPNGTIIAPGQYLVVASNLTKFSTVFPSVTNVIGPTIFDFNNGGETITIVDPSNTPRATLTYDDISPWPTLADGLGATMERVMTATNLSSPTAWFDGCRQGSPGKPYVPCPCLQVSLGPDAVLCTTGGTRTLTTGLSAPHTNRKFYWYRDGVALAVPVTTSSLNAVAAGIYKVFVDSMGCYKSDEMRLDPTLSFNLGPDISLCSPVVVTLNSLLPSTGITYSWTRNAATIPSATGPSYNVTSAGTYALTASAAGCVSQTDNVIVTSSAATPTDASRCMPGPATLSVAGPGTYNWFTTPTGGTSVFTGSSYTTTFTNTTTLYVEDASFYTGFVGPADSTLGNLSQWNDDNHTNNGGNEYRFRFDLLKNCILQYVTVYAASAQNVVINVWASNGTTLLHTRTVAVPSAGTHRIPLGFNLTGITSVSNTMDDYYLDARGTTGDLYYNRDNAVFPYTESGGYLRITGTSPSWVGGTNGWYPYIYKWEFTNVPGPCDRVPVTAFNTCAVPIDLLSLKASRIEENAVLVSWVSASEKNAGQYIVQRSVDGIYFTDVSTVNASGNTEKITSYEYLDNEAPVSRLYYRLKMVDQDGANELSYIVEASGKSIIEVFIAPNPSENYFEFLVSSFEQSLLKITITDLAGKVVWSSDQFNTNETIKLGEKLSPGSYVLTTDVSGLKYMNKIVKY